MYPRYISQAFSAASNELTDLQTNVNSLLNNPQYSSTLSSMVVNGTVTASNFVGDTLGVNATFTNITVTNPLASGATFTVNYNAKETVITEKGSGYTSAPTAASGPTQSVSLGVVTLTTDSGAVGSTTNQENAIIAYAWVSGSREIVDIVKQSGSRRYTVRGKDGIVYRAKLKGTSDAAADGEMDMYAYDAAGNTYYVTVGNTTTSFTGGKDTAALVLSTLSEGALMNNSGSTTNAVLILGFSVTLNKSLYTLCNN